MYKAHLDLVFSVMQRLADNGIIRDKSLEEIAKASFLGRRTVCRAINLLEEANRIKRLHGIGRSICNVYQINIDFNQPHKGHKE